VQPASVQRIGQAVGLIKAAPPVRQEIHDPSVAQLEGNEQSGHQYHPGPETDLDIGAWNKSQDKQTVHREDPLHFCKLYYTPICQYVKYKV